MGFRLQTRTQHVKTSCFEPSAAHATKFQKSLKNETKTSGAIPFGSAALTKIMHFAEILENTRIRKSLKPWPSYRSRRELGNSGTEPAESQI